MSGLEFGPILETGARLDVRAKPGPIAETSALYTPGGMALVEALEAGDEFFGQGFAGLGPEEAGGDAAVFFDGKGEGQEHFDVFLDIAGGFAEAGFGGIRSGWGGAGVLEGEDAGLAGAGTGDGFAEAVWVCDVVWVCYVVWVCERGGGFADVVWACEVELFFFVDLFFVVEDPGVVEAEVDADVAVLLEAAVVEEGGEADDFDGGGGWFPEDVEVGFGGAGDLGAGGVGGAAGAGVGGPKVPLHLELVGHIFVELLGGFADGGLDDGGGGVPVLLGTAVVDVEALEGGGFGEGDGVGGGGGDALALGVAAGEAPGADKGELAHDGDERGGERFEAEVGEPEAEVELIGHGV